MNIIKGKYFIFICIFIISSALYSFGVFDIFLKKELIDEKYDLGDFTFSGQSLSGKFNGNGEINFNDGSKYKGDFKNGCFDGEGVFEGHDGWMLNGIFDKGDISIGNLKLNDGKSLKYKNGEYECTSENGWKYTGELNELGQPSQGTFYYADGSTYNGVFSNGLAKGEGTYTSKDKKIVYSGTLDKGLFDGQGSLSINGTTYEGNFVKGFPDGYGEYKSVNGCTYKGYFSHGVFNGDGTIVKEGGTEVLGKWAKGKRVE